MRSLSRHVLALLGAAMIPSTVLAQAPEPKEYKAGLADLMLVYVQPRHAKLGLAGEAGNWDQAMFSVTELIHALQRAGGQVPKWRQLLIPEMTASVIDGPIGTVVKAIKAKDASAFKLGYQELTNGCNACHAAANLDHIKIKPASQSSFPNQEFAPAKR